MLCMGRTGGASLFIAMVSLGTKATNKFTHPTSFTEIYHFTTWDQLTPAQLFFSVEDFFSRREPKFWNIMFSYSAGLNWFWWIHKIIRKRTGQCSFMCSAILPSSGLTTRYKGPCQNGMTRIKDHKIWLYERQIKFIIVFIFIGFFVTKTVFVFLIISLCAVIYSSVLATENWNPIIGWSSLWSFYLIKVDKGV